MNGLFVVNGFRLSKAPRKSAPAIFEENTVANCSVCNAETPAAKSPTYTPSDMQRVVGNGFTPDDATLTRWMTEKNLTREAALADWKQRVATSSSDWLLCRNCAGRAAPYRQSSVEKKRLPRWAWVLIGVAAFVVDRVDRQCPHPQSAGAFAGRFRSRSGGRFGDCILARWIAAGRRRHREAHQGVRCENGQGAAQVGGSGSRPSPAWRSRPMDRYWLRRAKRMSFACGM